MSIESIKEKLKGGSPFSAKGMKLLKKEAERMKACSFYNGTTKILLKKNKKCGFSFYSINKKIDICLHIGGKREKIKLTKEECLKLSKFLTL